MQEKSYAIVALKDILTRALAAAALEQAGVELAGWDLEFAQMSREAQAEWLIQLFEVLVEHG
jgi:hypothetical protein